MSQEPNLALEKELLDLGFNKLFIYNVPPGVVLNSETAKKFSLIDSKSYIFNSFNILPSAFEKDKYFLSPPEPSKEYSDGIFFGAHSLESIIIWLKENKKIWNQV
jgi:hypothetical protein